MTMREAQRIADQQDGIIPLNFWQWMAEFLRLFK